MSDFITVNDLLASDGLRTEIYTFPEDSPPRLAGKTVKVRELTAGQSQRIDRAQKLDDPDAKETVGMEIIAECLLGGDDQPLFSATDVERLRNVSGRFIEDVMEILQRLQRVKPGKSEPTT